MNIYIKYNIKTDYYIILSLLLFMLFIGDVQKAFAGVTTPVLKWRQDCSNWQCDDAWYASPAVADLDNDGKPEVITGSYRVSVLNGDDGGVKFASEKSGRIWPGIGIDDIDADGNLEIITGDNTGSVTVRDHTGEIVWRRSPSGKEIRSLAVVDLDNDGVMEIIAGTAGGRLNTWVYGHDGGLRSGWPRPVDGDGKTEGYAAGIYNDNIAVADLDEDGRMEIVVPSDVHYICAYKDDGTPIKANEIYGGKVWGGVGIWESLNTELKGWGECNGNRAESYRTNFANGPAVTADMDGDGKLEIVVVGNVYDCKIGDPEGSAYLGVYVLNADRGRFKTDRFDWTNPPVDTGAPLSLNYEIIENPTPNPAVADLNGDGYKEIVFSSYDGNVHAITLDKTEFRAGAGGRWPFSLNRPEEGIYWYATEPVIADLNNDGKAEVIVATWPQRGSHKTGAVIILNYLGNEIFRTSLPKPLYDESYNGALAAPTLDDIDGDPDLELVLTTRYTGTLAWDLPGTESAKVLWGTGRGNYGRSGKATAAVTDELVNEKIFVDVTPKVFVGALTRMGDRWDDEVKAEDDHQLKCINKTVQGMQVMERSAIRISVNVGIRIGVELQAGSAGTIPVEYWIGSYTPFGWVSLTQNAWMPGFSPFAVMPVTPFPEQTILETFLPEGYYIFFFALDERTDGILQPDVFDMKELVIE